MTKLLFSTTAMQRADGGTGPHIHACIRQKLRAEAQAMAEEQYTPDVCKWDRCSRPAKIWQTRKDFLTHLHLHIQTLDLLPSRIIPVRACKWQLSPGLPCNESDCEDWNEHFAEVHSINTQLQIKVHYCIMCAQWYVFPALPFAINFLTFCVLGSVIISGMVANGRSIHSTISTSYSLLLWNE